MTDKYLIERGYKKYNPTPFDNASVVARYQKRFDDDFGKKYFIDVLKWSNDFISAEHRNKNFSYEYELYTTMYEEEDALILHFYSSWELENVEKFAEDFFEKMKPNYYEIWDSNKEVDKE